MTDIMTLRLKGKDKELLSLASRLTGIPASKMLYPFLEEGIRINLGASILFQIDRSVQMNRNRYERFVDALRDRERVRSGTSGDLMEDPLRDLMPKIISDYFWMLRETKAIPRMEQAMADIQFTTDVGYIDPSMIQIACLSLGDAYIANGLPLNRIDLVQATRLFFHVMTSMTYRRYARGTEKALSTRWYTSQETINKLVEEMAERYESRYPARVVEAIEVKEAIPVEERPSVRKKPVPIPRSQGR